MMMFGRGFWNSCEGFKYFGYYHGVGIIVAVVVVLLLFMLFKRSGRRTSNDEIINALKMKYVNGEITEEEYILKKKVLSGK